MGRKRGDAEERGESQNQSDWIIKPTQVWRCSHTLPGCVSDEGRVGWGQQVGDRLAAVKPEDSHEHGTGAFRPAGSEVLRLAQAGGLAGGGLIPP